MQKTMIEELDRSAAIIIGGSEVVPRFRIAIPGETDQVVLLPLPDALDERRRRLSLVSGYMTGWVRAGSCSRRSWPNLTPPQASPSPAQKCSVPSD